jgi:hypothetical protein
MAMPADMRNRTLNDLLTRIHLSIDSLAEELVPEQPLLALALRNQAAHIPRPDPPLANLSLRGARRACAALRPLLYDALAEGLLDGREFDAWMVRRLKAERALAARR